MNIQQKRDYLFQLEDYDDGISAQEVEILEKLTFDKSSGIRSDVAAILVKFVNRKTKKLLIELMHDKNTLVRTEAADSACVYFYQDIYDILKNEMRLDPYYLVRGYAIKSMVCVGLKLQKSYAKMKETVESSLLAEKNPYCKLCCYKALYDLGENQYLHNIVGIYVSKNYQNRCAVLNVLCNIASISNKEIIIQFVKSIQKDKEPLAVQGYIDNLKAKLDCL